MRDLSGFRQAANAEYIMMHAKALELYGIAALPASRHCLMLIGVTHAGHLNNRPGIDNPYAARDVISRIEYLLG